MTTRIISQDQKSKRQFKKNSKSRGNKKKKNPKKLFVKHLVAAQKYKSEANYPTKRLKSLRNQCPNLRNKRYCRRK